MPRGRCGESSSRLSQMFAFVAEPSLFLESPSKRIWPPRDSVEVTSLSDHDLHQLQYQDRIMDQAVEQLEALANGATEAMMLQFGDLNVSNVSTEPRLFEFDAPTVCRTWPGPRYGPASLHKQIVHPKTKSSSRSFTKKRGPEMKHGQSTETARPSTVTPPLDSACSSAARIPPLHLMQLPAEVRNQIWTLLAVFEKPIKAHLRPIRPLKQGKRGKIVVRRFPQEPLVSAANKQLRREVLSLFYSMNTFTFEKSASNVYKEHNMMEIASMRAWKPRADVIHFLSNLQIRFKDELVSYIIQRDSTGVPKISARCRMCAAETRNLVTCKGDVFELAMELVGERTVWLSAWGQKQGRICRGCGRDMTKIP